MTGLSKKVNVEFYTDQELFNELGRRFKGFVFVGECLTKESVSSSVMHNPMWFHGSYASILGYLEYGMLRVSKQITEMEPPLVGYENSDDDESESTDSR
jgi:hypothetical protein